MNPESIRKLIRQLRRKKGITQASLPPTRKNMGGMKRIKVYQCPECGNLISADARRMECLQQSEQILQEVAISLSNPAA